MQSGKVSHNILKRSVLKYITPRSENVLLGAGMGNDSSAISVGEGGAVLFSNNTVNMAGEDAVTHCFYRCHNDLVAAGAVPQFVMPTLTLPKQAQEEEIQTYMRNLDALCAVHGMQIIGGHTSVSEYVSRTVISLNMMGQGGERFPSRAEPGQSLIVTKSVGMEGTARLARRRKKELCLHYTLDFVERAEELLKQISVQEEAAFLYAHEVTAMHNVSEGGILAALWEFMERSGTGMEVDFKSIPILQSTVELCEFYRLNPYQLLSNGALLFAASDGESCVRLLAEQGVRANIIGRVTAKKQRILRNEEEVRFLDRPQPDALYQIGEI